MGAMKFWLISIISFIVVTVGTIFVPSSFLNRTLLMASCTIFSFNAALCTPNLGVEFDRVMAASTPVIENRPSTDLELPKNESVKLKQQEDLILAFAADEEKVGHRPITTKALSGEWKNKNGEILKDEAGNNLEFRAEAIEEIYQANRSVDLKPGSKIFDPGFRDGTVLPFSQDFHDPKKHFDNEKFIESSGLLKTLKSDIVYTLEPITKDTSEDKKTQIGKESRKILGQALHTLQDFYAHTNWVELGFENIDNRLGREIIPASPGDMHTSEPISQADVALAIAAQAAVAAKATTIESPYKQILALIGAKIFLELKPEDLASSQSTKPGKLKPEYSTKPKVNKVNDEAKKSLLTSGYFMGVGPVASCKVPLGKTRHGTIYAGCPNGLNKDEEGRPGYEEAHELAVMATQDYVNQIIYEEPSIQDNIPAIKVLMGIKDIQAIKEDPCKLEKNQNLEECKLKGGRSTGDPHLATFDGLTYSLQTVGESILTKSSDGTFEIQARHAPFNSSMSINSAVAVKIGSDRVALYAQDVPDADTSTPLRVNGEPTTIQEDKLALPGGGTILKQGSTYVINAPKGEKVLVSPSGAGDSAFLNLSPFVYNRAGQYTGLLGNVNGNPNDDLQIRGGGNISEIRSTLGDVNKQSLKSSGVEASRHVGCC